LDFDDDKWTGAIYSDPNKLSLSVKEWCFHEVNMKHVATGVVDDRIFEYLIHTQNIVVCDRIPYIYRDGYYQMDFEGTKIKTLIKACCLQRFKRSTTSDRVYKLFLQEDSIETTLDQMNRHKGYYINFQNGMYDVIHKKMCTHSPKIMSINQIPWEYDPDGDHGDGTEIEKFLNQAIPDEDDREMLLEYIGLCCSIDKDQQKMLVICGDGGTGKSTIINLIQKIVGKQNISNVAMSNLSEKFQAISMRGKLLNSCADLEIDALDDVTTIKKLVGEDSMSDSYKGKNIISFDNYAKLLFSTNELPLVRNEKTEGFYRRLMVLTMNEKPKRRDPKLPQKLEQEIPYLIHLAMEALGRMYKRGYILESLNSELKVRQLRNDSDTIEAFLSEKCRRADEESRIERSEIYDSYTKYCTDEERQSHKKNAFFKALRNKGFEEIKTHGTWYFTGIAFKPDTSGEEFMPVPQAAPGDGIPFDA
jgi:P4 family phage/plasmid primase-like protien